MNTWQQDRWEIKESRGYFYVYLGGMYTTHRYESLHEAIWKTEQKYDVDLSQLTKIPAPLY